MIDTSAIKLLTIMLKVTSTFIILVKQTNCNMGKVDFLLFFLYLPGVRQGRIFSPKLFYIYVNDISDIIA